MLAALLQVHTTGKSFQDQLETIASRVLEQYESDPRRTHVSLYNLLYRSVGSTSLLDEDTLDLEQMSEDEWSTLVTQVVEEMTTAPELLLQDKPSTRAYRPVYVAFWRTLARVCLEGSRLQIEVVRDLWARLADMVSVGQPDLREAATLVVFAMGHAVLERTQVLKDKVQVAQRQYQAAQKSQKVKAASLKDQLEGWKRTLKDLEDLVESQILAGVFSQRYRDSTPQIRATSLDALSDMIALRPDLLVKGTYLKYFGWMLSDKQPLVRYSAVVGLLEAFRVAKEGSMSLVIQKFATRLADCVLDKDVTVQEKSMELLLELARGTMLDFLEDDSVWEQINLRALDPDTSPQVRKDALLFLLEQLEAFDQSTVTNMETHDVAKMESLVDWCVG